ncbi:MAG: ATP-dependent DNA helicase RecG [Eubacteriales bacterium]|nr:ATP-dependent DNA helicase RecG [Oscillospiraceae bacterium]MDY3924600.1 ATP-dependent DNA helicase RecG [Eubacteriales bacterium]
MDALLAAPLLRLPGVGEKRAEQLARLGLHTVSDLLFHFPRAYENRGDVVSLAGTQEPARAGARQAVILTVSTAPRRSRLKNRMTLLKFRAFDDSGTCEVAFFNQDYLADSFPIGAVFRFFGRVERTGRGFSLTNPAFEPYTEGSALPPLFPVYPLTEGLSNKLISGLIRQAMPAIARMEDPLPEDIREREGLCTLAFALRTVHCPPDFQSLHTAKTRLAFDEFFRFALGLGMQGGGARVGGAPVCCVSEETFAGFRALLPYQLTAAQERTIAEIRHDMASGTAMNRMLVGDVGCGKTVCAAAAVYVAVRSGRQAAIMAPTGILAAQHAAELIPLFARIGIRGELLTGATTAARKRKIRAALADPDPAARLDFVIGTQALLSAGVDFAAPALVVTDEQHRFGVNQRAALSDKNRHAHLLCMSATPIPRSLALVLYGDLDVSRIDQMPPGRQRVDTFVVDESYRARLDAFIRKNVAAGGQVYIVCPAVEQAEGAEEADEAGLIPLTADFAAATPPAPTLPPLRAAVQYAAELAERLPDLRIGFVHGRMKQAEKDGIMQAFTAGEVQVLVSTTVIEVGVNVPNACLMIVENAERFGLSQLHQLRGRVGRGNRKSYCILVRAGGGDAARARLEVMRTTYDGFRIAEQDLAQRGPGDFLAPAAGGSIRQSGGFRLAEGWNDAGLMDRAFGDARALLASDPTLGEHPLLRDAVRRGFDVGAGDILN